MTKMKYDISANDSALSAPGRTENTIAKSYRRRLQDAIVSYTRKLNLERRLTCNERRVYTAPNYTGPSRRYIVDRRLMPKGRRVMDL